MIYSIDRLISTGNLKHETSTTTVDYAMAWIRYYIEKFNQEAIFVDLLTDDGATIGIYHLENRGDHWTWRHFSRHHGDNGLIRDIVLERALSTIARKWE